MIQHAPSIVLAAWAALIAVGCTWIVPMLALFALAVVVAGREYLR